MFLLSDKISHAHLLFWGGKYTKSGKLLQDTPVLPQVVKLGHAPDKIQV